MHIYAFGSICRGEVVGDSDVDLLAVVDGLDHRFSPHVFSIYSYARIRELWKQGNPFAWHLSLESRLLFASDGEDFLCSLGPPEPYADCASDCQKFHSLFHEAWKSAKADLHSMVFDLSVIFLSIRNIATCYSLAMTRAPLFGRSAALQLQHHPLSIPSDIYAVLERARILSTRAIGTAPTLRETRMALRACPAIDEWMVSLEGEAMTGA